VKIVDIDLGAEMAKMWKLYTYWSRSSDG